MTDAPWAGAAPQYIGWIPNVLGHLSFSLIGRGTSPRAFCAPSGEGRGGSQKVIAFQPRHSDDYALPKWITKWTRPLGTQDWLLVGETEEASYPSSKNSPASDPKGDLYRDKRGMLRGTIYVLPSIGWNAGIIAQTRFRFSRLLFRWRIATTIDQLNRASPTNVVDVMSDLQWAKSRGLHFAEIEAGILRTGEARFWFSAPRQAEPASSLAEQEGADHPESERTLAQIAYFFVKDITHLHTHHHHSQDGMIPFREVTSGDTEGEREWQRQSMWALSRSIEEYVRRSSRDDLRAALGMIPYAENFHSLYGGMHRVPGALHEFSSIKDHELEHYNFEPLRKMVATMLESRTSTLAARTALFASIIPISLSASIAINAIGSQFSPSVEWPFSLSQIAHQYPQWTSLCILLALWVIYRLAYQEAKDDAWIFVIFRTITRTWKAITVSILRKVPGIPYWLAWLALLMVQGACIYGFGRLAFSLVPK